jgi:hypothetical protein
MKRSYRRVGLFRIPLRVPKQHAEWGEQLTDSPNSHVALRQWLDRVEAWATTVRRTHRGKSHAVLASRILGKVGLLRRLVETIDQQSDRHFVLTEAIHFARDVRDLEMNLALLSSVQVQRKVNAGRKRAVNANRKIMVRAYQRAKKKARTKKELASMLGVTREGLRQWENRQQRT